MNFHLMIAMLMKIKTFNLLSTYIDSYGSLHAYIFDRQEQIATWWEFGEGEHYQLAHMLDLTHHQDKEKEDKLNKETLEL